jgi:TonB-linked SusC/RagA family outer membrane protein
MKINKSLILAIIITAINVANINIYAQKSVVKGIVISQTDNQPLIGATVVEMDKNKRYINGTITDINGNFVLPISNTTNSIVVSFIGYKSQEFPGTSTNLNVLLEEDKFTLKEVEIVGKSSKTITNNGFLTIDDANNVASIKKIDPKVLEDLPSVSIDDALQGRIAGIDIVGISGDPGAGSTIKIRNSSSLSGSTNPLIVVDRIPQDTRINNAFSLSSATSENFAQLLNISPSDIADIQVLTDASATAIYGTQASNGVILITTKRGSKGRVTVNYTDRFTIYQQPKPIPMLNGDEYATLIPEAYMNANDMPLNTTYQREFNNDPSDPLYYNYNKNTDWIGAITRTGIGNDQNLAISGGGDKATYRFSLNHLYQSGTTIGTLLQRITSTLNIDYKVSDKLSFKADIKYSHTDNDRNFDVKDYFKLSADRNVRTIAYIKMPNMAIYENIYNPITGKYEETSNYFSPESNAQGTFPNNYNPVALAKEAINNVLTDEIKPTFSISYKILKWLSFNSDINLTVKNSITKAFLPQIATGRSTYDENANLSNNYDEQSYVTYTNSNLLFNPTLNENHKFSAVLAATTNSGNGMAYQIKGRNSPNSELQDIINTSTITYIWSNRYTFKNYALVFNANYSFRDKYIVDFAIRGQADPKYGDNYIFGLFGGAGAKWRVSNENFMKSLTFINDFTIRGNWGINGNDVTATNGKFSRYQSYSFSYLGQRGVKPNNLELKNYRWERKTQPNIGFNLQMFENKFGIDLNFWYEKVRDGFRKNMDLPLSSGFDKIDVNILEAHNKGFDLYLNSTIIDKESFKLDFRFNISRSQFIPENLSASYNTNIAWITPTNGVFLDNLRDSTPLGSVFGLRYLGIYTDLESTIAIDEQGNKIYDAQGNPVYMSYNYPDVKYQFKPGDTKYEDINHDGNINYNDVVYLGNSNPLLTGGFGSSMIYKNFYLDLYCYYRYKVTIINMTRYYTENMSSYDNQSTAVLRRWRKPGDQTDIPRAVLGTNYNSIGSDRFTEDGSFLRLKTITIGYNFSKNIVNKLKLKNAKLYCTITNLFTLTKYTGQDPEVSIEPVGGKLTAIDNARTPRSKDITFGLNIGF